jgi:hypothetical protein
MTLGAAIFFISAIYILYARSKIDRRFSTGYRDNWTPNKKLFYGSYAGLALSVVILLTSNQMEKRFDEVSSVVNREAPATAKTGANPKSVEGSYEFQQEGYRGELSIQKRGDGNTYFVFDTVTADDKAHTCLVEFEAKFLSTDTKMRSASFEDGGCRGLVFISDDGTLEVSSEGCASACGIGGNFDGEYAKK